MRIYSYSHRLINALTFFVLTWGAQKNFREAISVCSKMGEKMSEVLGRLGNVDPLSINPIPLIGTIIGILIVRPLKGGVD